MWYHTGYISFKTSCCQPGIPISPVFCGEYSGTMRRVLQYRHKDTGAALSFYPIGQSLKPLFSAKAKKKKPCNH